MRKILVSVRGVFHVPSQHTTSFLAISASVAGLAGTSAARSEECAQIDERAHALPCLDTAELRP